MKLKMSCSSRLDISFKLGMCHSVMMVVAAAIAVVANMHRVNYLRLKEMSTTQ